MIDDGKHNILGVNISAVDYEGAIERVMDAANAGQPLAVSALAVHGLMTGALDSEHKYRLNRFDLLCPDGQPVRWALGWLHGKRLPDRVYGPNLMLKLCERAAKDGTPIFLFGGSEELLGQLQSSLLAKFPGLQIAGTRASKFRTVNAEERQELIDDIKASGAKITFVGLGCPRQEVFTYEMRDDLSMPLLAVGAAFNFHAGLLDQAPKWLQDRGLEWAYRFTKEPRRLFHRYMVLNPMYLGMLGLQMTGLKRPAADGEEPKAMVCYG